MTTHVVAALGRIAARIEMPAQSGHNKFEGYKYSTRDDVFEVVRRELIEEGIIWIPSAKITAFEAAPPTKKGLAQFRTHIAVRASFYHPEDADPLVVDFAGESVTTTDRGASMATTTAIRTGLINLFMLMGTDPDEGARKQQKAAPVRRNPDPAPATPPDENAQAIADIVKVLRKAVDSETATQFVTKYIPWVEAQNGNSMPLERYPVARLQKWKSQLDKLETGELRTKISESLQKMEA